MTAAQIFSDPNKPQWIAKVALGAAGWLLAAGCLKAYRGYRKDRKRAQLESPTDLSGCAHVLLTMLKSKCGLRDNDSRKIRVTIHRVVPPEGKELAPQWLEQVIPYVGHQGGQPGRRFPIGRGIIGRVARDHTPYAASWDGTNPHEFIEESVKEWGFTPKEAEDNVTWRRSWFGVPISGKNEDDTIGVVFVDSSEPGVFTEEVQGSIVSACFGIAAYIKERYGQSDVEGVKPIQGSHVVSSQGAKLVVERIELSVEAKTHLSTGVKSLKGPAPQPPADVQGRDVLPPRDSRG